MAKNKSLEKYVNIEKKIAQPVISEESEGSTDSESVEQEVFVKPKKVKEVVVEDEKPKPKRQLSEKQKAAFEKARKVLAEKMQYVRQKKRKKN